VQILFILLETATFFSDMCSHMHFQAVGMRKSFSTLLARLRRFFSVCSHVHCKVACLWKSFFTLLARPVARFQDLVGYNTFLGGQDFCFYYIFKTNFSGRNKIWEGHKINFGGHCPRMSPRGYRPVPSNSKVFLKYVFAYALSDCLPVKIFFHTPGNSKVFLRCVFACAL